MTARILLIEDEIDLARTVVYALQRDGFQVQHAETGRRGLELLREAPPVDLVLLDLMLPDLSGTEICRQIRADPQIRDVLVLMLTARGEEIDRVVGFEVGADDYLVKPFSVRELTWRIRALLRRTEAQVGADGSYQFGPLRLDLAGHRCWLQGEALPLTAIELRLLEQFMARRGRVLSRDALLDAVWGRGTEVNERTVDANVKRLREKLGSAGHWIETLRGVGYRFSDQPEAQR